MYPKVIYLIMCIMYFGETVGVSMLSQLEITRGCFMDYGQTFDQIEDVKSVQACTVVCADKSQCSSFIFDQGSSSCSINSQDVPGGFPSPCETTVVYGQMVQDRSREMSLGTCLTNPDCTVSHTECVDGQCRCINGYSLQTSTSTCVTECSSYGDTFQVYPGYVIVANNDAAFSSITSLTDCWIACVNEDRFVCRTGEFTGDACRLSMATVNDNVSYDEQEGTVFFHRNCA